MIHSQQTKRKIKTTTKTKIFLYSIFLITVIPTIYVYIQHAIVEGEASLEAKTETKKLKTFIEGLLFFVIGLGYVVATCFMFLCPTSRLPYLVIIVGTIAVVILYYFRIYGIPIPGTQIVIVDLSSDWRDVVTKIAQQILVVPVTALYMIRKKD
jgi:hypothetical protein